MTTLFISDLHLKEDQPHITQGLLDFLSRTAEGADAVYILGDLFEYWIGDDAANLLGVEPILAAMRARADKTPCFFIAGNRDFLVRDAFSRETGFTLLNDETVVELYGVPTLLLHGDSLCTDDVAHQKFRQEMVTNTAWCDAFLSQPIPQRVEMAQMAREQSQTQGKQVDQSIMDVTDSAVLEAFSQHDVSWMIHGHTHRQAVHVYDAAGVVQPPIGNHAYSVSRSPAIKQQTPHKLTRTVLGDWGSTNSVLAVTPNGEDVMFAISNHALI